MRKSAITAFAFTGSLLAAYCFGSTASCVACAILLLLSVVALISKHRAAPLAVALTVAVAFGCAVMHFTVIKADNIENTYSGKSANCIGIIEDVKPTESGKRAYVRIISADGKDTDFKAVSYFGNKDGISERRYVVGNFDFFSIDDHEGFPSRDYYFGKGISLGAYAYGAVSVDETHGDTAVYYLRDRINGVFDRYTGDMSYLASGIVLGDKDGFSAEWKEKLSQDGISHLFAVSGLHVSILLGALFFLLEKLKLSKLLRTVTVCAFALFYMYLVGFTPSVCRAVIMSGCAVMGGIWGRRTDSITSLAVSAAVLCLISPNGVIDLSFQLSFLATAGVIFAVFYAFRPISESVSDGFFTKIGLYVYRVTVTSVFAVAFCMPAIAHYFGSVSAMSPIANLICAPVAELFLLLCFILLAVSFSPLIAGSVGFITQKAGEVFVFLADRISASGIMLDVSHPAVKYISTALVICAVSAVLFNVKRKRQIVCVCPLLICVTALAFGLF